MIVVDLTGEMPVVWFDGTRVYYRTVAATSGMLTIASLNSRGNNLVDSPQHSPHKSCGSFNSPEHHLGAFPDYDTHDARRLQGKIITTYNMTCIWNGDEDGGFLLRHVLV